jgi:hypothetical protein
LKSRFHRAPHHNFSKWLNQNIINYRLTVRVYLQTQFRYIKIFFNHLLELLLTLFKFYLPTIFLLLFIYLPQTCIKVWLNDLANETNKNFLVDTYFYIDIDQHVDILYFNWICNEFDSNHADQFCNFSYFSQV